MNIKTFSHLTQISAHTLRYYEKIGLLLHVRRDSKGHRDYSDADVAWVEFVKRLKETDMPLKEIKAFADLRYRGDETVKERLKLLEKHQLRVDENVKKLLSHQEKLRTKITLYKEWDAIQVSAEKDLT